MKDKRTFVQPALLCFLVLGLHSPVAWAGNWFVPTPTCAQEIWAVNSSTEPSNLWIAPPHRDGDTGNEKGFEVPARGQLKLTASDFPPEIFAQIKTRADAKVRLVQKKQNGWEILPEGRSSRRQGRPDPGSEALFVTNVSPIRQEGKILVRSPQGDLTHIFSLEAFSETKLTLPAESNEVSVDGESNLMAYFRAGDQIQILKPVAEEAKPKNPVSFLVSDSDRARSFVVSLEDPALIAQARTQLAHPEEFHSRILIAQIAPGSANNQDLTSPLRGSWSWHVSKVFRFADFASQTCDGSPEFVEDFLPIWLQSGSPICFWNYRVVQELN